MTCPNCGNSVADHLKFCSKCGTPIIAAPYTPPVNPAPPAWQLNAPFAPVKRKSRTGKILLIVGGVLLVLMIGIGVAIYFGVKSYVQSARTSAPYALAESTLRESPKIKERMGEIKAIGVPIGTYKEDADGTGFAAYVMSVDAEKASGQYIVAMDKYQSNWRVQQAHVKLSSGEEIKIVDGARNVPSYGSTDSDTNQNENQNENLSENQNENQNENTAPANSNNSNQKTKTISGGVLNGKAVSLPKPTYPAAAKSVRASGTVVVQVTVDEEGKVITASAVSGHPLLRASAVAAARQARFSPTKLSGVPVKVTGVITYNFTPD